MQLNNKVSIFKALIWFCRVCFQGVKRCIIDKVIVQMARHYLYSYSDTTAYCFHDCWLIIK